MSREMRQTRLPGVGTKYGLELDGGGRIAVIQRVDGEQELYWFRRADDDEPRVVHLEDDEARQLGAVLGGAYERPKIVEELEIAIGERSRSSGSPFRTAPPSASRSPTARSGHALASRSSRSSGIPSRLRAPSRPTSSRRATRS